MAFTVKCNTCNIVIDELLAYVQNKISIIDEERLTRICVSAFKNEEIIRSKALLFESLPTDKRKISRRRRGKENRDVEDIISLFKGTDPEVMPVFVARDLEKLPPVTFDHVDVTKLLKDLLILQTELSDIKSKYVTSEQLEELKLELRSRVSVSDVSTPNQYRNIRINTRRGAACLDSGPRGLSHIDMTVTDNDIGNLSVSPKENQVIGPPQIYPQISPINSVERSEPVTRQSAEAAGSAEVRPTPAPAQARRETLLPEPAAERQLFAGSTMR